MGIFWGRVAAATAVIAAIAGCASAPEQGATRSGPLLFPPAPEEPRFVYERTIYSSADISEKDRNSTLRQLLTGEAERGGEGVGKPYGVAARRGRIFVGDSINASVKLFDVPGRRFLSIGGNELRMPLGLDVDDAGQLYVVDATAKVVRVYDTDGNQVKVFGGPSWFARPTGVAVDPRGERVYVADTGGVTKSEEHRVRVFDARDGKHLFDFGKRGSQPGEFNLLRDVAVAPDGKVYVIDSGNFRIQVFDRDGKFLFTFGAVGRFPGQFARPREIAIDQRGNVYVSDAAFGNFQIFDAQGKLLMHIGDRGERDSPARYMLPAGIAVDLDGRVYLADQFFRKIDVYRPAALKAEEGHVAKAEPAKPAAR